MVAYQQILSSPRSTRGSLWEDYCLIFLLFPSWNITHSVQQCAAMLILNPTASLHLHLALVCISRLFLDNLKVLVWGCPYKENTHTHTAVNLHINTHLSSLANHLFSCTNSIQTPYIDYSSFKLRLDKSFFFFALSYYKGKGWLHNVMPVE